MSPTKQKKDMLMNTALPKTVKKLGIEPSDATKVSPSLGSLEAVNSKFEKGVEQNRRPSNITGKSALVYSFCEAAIIPAVATATYISVGSGETLLAKMGDGVLSTVLGCATLMGTKIGVSYLSGIGQKIYKKKPFIEGFGEALNDVCEIEYDGKAFVAGLAVSTVLSVGGATLLPETRELKIENIEENTTQVSQAYTPRAVSFKIV